MGTMPAEQVRASRPLWLVFFVLFLVAAGLGAWGLAELTRPADQCPPPAAQPCGYTPTDIVYFDAQLFLLGSEPLQNGGPFPLPLEVARFLAPVATAYGVAASVWDTLADRHRRRAARRARGHAIIIGDDPFAVTLAHNLRSAGTPTVLVTADRDADRTAGLVVVGDVRDPAVLRAAGLPQAATVYACLADSAANAAVVAAVATLTGQAQTAPTDAHDHPEPLVCYARIADSELALALKARRVGLSTASEFRLDFFTPEEIAARKLAARILEPHLGSHDGVPSVAIVGLGPFGRALVVELARLWRVRSGGPPLPLLLVEMDASSQLTDLRRRYRLIDEKCVPRARDESSATVDLGTIPNGFEPAAAPGARHLVLCDQSEETGLRRALNTTRSAADVGQTVTVCLGQRTALGDLLHPRLLDPGPGQVRIFAIVNEAAEPDELRNDTLTVLARAIHGQYLIAEQEKGTAIGSSESMELWDGLPEDLRTANYRQATGIGAKLNEINAVVVPMTYPTTGFTFHPDEIDLLARIEHERWCAERRSQGWTFAPIRDNARKRHNLLVNWTELPSEHRAKDTATIRNLPDLLADHGLQILRLH
ncbi:NAD-binding protein [Frankia sp. Cppng1_Ct_nod]|uniref:NAD-binding protein n=1 Tax=Frankia sp. Cppng1_Ct_nod TaxID=2897162 RepID=UPI001040FF38|nr:NAD-binding protein [Frankia sp. Cppng1_Ct_nod]